MISRRSLLAAASALLITSALPAEAALKSKPKLKTGQVYLIRGFANIFSTGLDTLGKQLAADGVKAEVLSLPNTDAFARRIAEKYRASKDARPIVLVGHSLGADMTFAVARALEPMKIPVALIISFDPTGKGPVPRNVKKALNYYTGGETLWSPVTPMPGFKGDLANINLRQGDTAIKGIGHFNIDKNPGLHDRTIRDIKAALRAR
ncbi:thioesterase domain-containing protein [Rhizobium sp. AG855]|uniref:thioesterase domain-containing protein n=1 Tax=Rhizobium sp. AG855 TaxID=2183898 RepID=UPI000E72A09E|nr:thioesterase domain-containing protein [Rhizobium sp. AG855]RKE84508.1 thioesterase superfamily protein [Rhizobium sp. AG855]